MMLGVAFGGMGSLLSGANLARIGFMAASALGMYLLNGGKEKGEVGRLDDLKVSSSSYGRGIPIVYGTMRVTGNMIWATDFEEVVRYMTPKGEKSGKKGEKKGTPYYEYYANFAMLLSEGPVEELLRVWADSNLIYDKHNPDNPDIVKIGFSQGDEDSGGKKIGAFSKGKKKGNQGGDAGNFNFRYYPGTESQAKDPFMVQKQGEDLVPAYRGRAYLFFQRMKLQDFGNRIPTITAEVATKKKVEFNYSVLTNLPDTEDLEVRGAAMVTIDPERYKLYVEEQERTSPTTVDRIIRIYDLSSSREVRRITFDEIADINDNVHTIKDLIGLAGNGDIVARLTAGNSSVVGFYDPNTFVLKKTFGSFGPSLSNGPDRIVWPLKAAPAGYIQLTAGLTEDDVEVTPTRATIIRSMAGWHYVFSEDHEPICFFDLPGGFSTNMAGPIITEITPFGGVFYATSVTNTFSQAQLIRVEWEMELTPTGLNPYAITNGHSIDPDVRVIRELVSPGGTNFVDIVLPQLISGTEEVIWFEEYNYTDPLQQGTWVVVTDARDKTGQIIHTERLSTSIFAMPSTGGMDYSPINTSRRFTWLASNEVWSYDFGFRTLNHYKYGVNFLEGDYQSYWPARGAILKQITDPDDDERKWALAYVDRNSQVPVDIHFMISDLAERVGIPPEKVDLTLLDEQEIIGYIIENPTSARRVIEELAQVFMFDVVESDYRLKAVSRGGSSVVTVPQKDLGIADRDTSDHFVETRVQEIDLPQTVVVSFINPDKDYQTNSQHYRRPRSPQSVMQSRDKLELNLSMAMKKTFAKQLAHKINMTLWTERITYDTMLPWKYLPYDPTDVMTFEMDDGLVFETRMMQMNVGANFSIEATGVTQTPAAYVSDAVAQDDGGVIYDDTPFPPQTEALVADVPYLEDADDIGNSQFGYYWGAAAYTAGFRGAVVEYRLAGLDWDLVNIAAQEVVWGFVAEAIPAPPWGPWVTDDVNTIRLLPTYPYDDVYSWESIPESQWPTTVNTVIIGGEIIYFRDVEIGDNGEVYISHLIRGARGTENAAYHHNTLEKFVLETTGLQLEDVSFAHLNKTFEFRSFSTYAIMPPAKQVKVLTGATHKPWGPNYFTREPDGSSIKFRWKRRTRLGGELKDGTGTVPLNEESTEFEFYILSQPYDPDFFDPDNPSTYIRKFAPLSSESVNYTSSQRSADGTTLTQVFHVVCFQISANVGRGFAGYDTIYYNSLT